MLGLHNLYHFQRTGVLHQLQNPKNFLWLFPGSGKSVTTLTTFAHLKKLGLVLSALVLAPMRVAQSVWHTEARKWSHLQHLTFSRILGNPQERMNALVKPADIYVTNFENIVWLVTQLTHYYPAGGYPFDYLVVDESTKLKSCDTKRMEAMLKIVNYFNWRTLLTGTPAANGLLDVFGQALIMDSGERLGTAYNAFRDAYFVKADRNGYKYKPTALGEQFIHERLHDVTLNLKNEGYVDVPKLIVNDIYVDIPTRARKVYDDMERSMFATLEDGTDVEVLFAASKGIKLRQIANGVVFHDTELRLWKPVHEAKLDALDELIEEYSGEPLLVFYQFIPDKERILKRYPWAKCFTGTTAHQFEVMLQEWKRGDIRMLLAHPASAGHGIDGLQEGGRHMVMFGLDHSLEKYEQSIARIQRQGGDLSRPVLLHRILARDSVDDAIADSLIVKDGVQTGLRDAIDAYRKRRGL